MGPIGFEGYSNTDYIEAYLNLNYQITFWYVQIFKLGITSVINICKHVYTLSNSKNMKTKNCNY